MTGRSRTTFDDFEQLFREFLVRRANDLANGRNEKAAALLDLDVNHYRKLKRQYGIGGRADGAKSATHAERRPARGPAMKV